jgi:hypothetical protein
MLKPRLLCLLALAAFGCTPPLTADDALPYQTCSVDSDCVADSLDCSNCGTPIAVNAAKQVEFDQFRGCWPPSTSNSECGIGLEGSPPSNFGGFGCQAPICAAGRCAIANNNCQGEFTAGSSGTSDFATGETSAGFGSTTSGGFTSGTTGGFTAGSSISASSSASGSSSGSDTGGTTGTGSPDGGFDGGGP